MPWYFMTSNFIDVENSSNKFMVLDSWSHARSSRGVIVQSHERATTY